MQEQVNKVKDDVENTGIGSDFPQENATSTPSTSSTPSTITSSTPSTITSSTPSTPIEWDLEIKPQAHLLDINLREVWRYKDLLWMFVKRDFTAQYKQTVLGPLWHFIQPLFTTVVFLVVFTNIAKISTDGVPPVLFYMSGITIWNYFSSCLNATSSTFVANAGIFGKVYFPRLVIPLSTVMSNIVKFGIQFLLLLAAMLWYKLAPSTPSITSTPSTPSTASTLILIPTIILIMAGLGLGLGIIISSMTTKYRDLTVLIGFAVQLLMYATPVVYPLSTITSEKLRFWITLNPLTPLVEAFRYAMLGVGSFDAGSFGYSIGFMVITLFIGLLIFSKVEKIFMDTV
ncbi:MAG: ABC transporter permease [Chitinophagaceae bacterium]|jgi:lipopolysaccharide transport system permease protein|nr:ABC transporter permease [Chitinophagaceae bacterium]